MLTPLPLHPKNARALNPRLRPIFSQKATSPPSHLPNPRNAPSSPPPGAKNAPLLRPLQQSLPPSSMDLQLRTGKLPQAPTRHGPPLLRCPLLPVFPSMGPKPCIHRLSLSSYGSRNINYKLLIPRTLGILAIGLPRPRGLIASVLRG